MKLSKGYEGFKAISLFIYIYFIYIYHLNTKETSRFTNKKAKPVW